MKNIIVIFLFCFFCSFTFAQSGGKYTPVKKGQSIAFDGILLDMNSAFSIMADIKSCEIKIEQEKDITKLEEQEKFKLHLSVKESENKIKIDNLKVENDSLSKQKKIIENDYLKLSKSNKIKNYIIVSALSVFIAYELFK
jgi:hypothetical protein